MKNRITRTKLLSLLLGVILILGLLVGCGTTVEDPPQISELPSIQSSPATSTEIIEVSDDLLLKELYYNESGNLTRVVEYKYDANGNIECEIDIGYEPLISTSEPIWEDYCYWVYNNGEKYPTKMNIYSVDSPDVWYSEYDYDEEGNVLVHFNYEPDGNISSIDVFENDEYGDPIKHTIMAGSSEVEWRYEYKRNDRGAIESKITYADTGKIEETQTYEYDSHGNLMKVSSDDGSWIEYEYISLEEALRAADSSPIQEELGADPSQGANSFNGGLASFIGCSVADIVKMFGDNYTVDCWSGASYITYENNPYYFYYGTTGPDFDFDGVPELSDIIFAVETYESGHLIFDSIYIGSSITDLEACIGKRVSLMFNEMDEVYVAEIFNNGYSYRFEFDSSGSIITFVTCSIG